MWNMLGMEAKSDGNVYVSDAAFGNIQMFNSAGELLLVIGRPGQGPGEFYLPADITVDAQDRIFVADLGNRRVQMFQYLGEPYIEDTKDEAQTQ